MLRPCHRRQPTGFSYTLYFILYTKCLAWKKVVTFCWLKLNVLTKNGSEHTTSVSFKWLFISQSGIFRFLYACQPHSTLLLNNVYHVNTRLGLLAKYYLRKWSPACWSSWWWGWLAGCWTPGNWNVSRCHGTLITRPCHLTTCYTALAMYDCNLCFISN